MAKTDFYDEDRAQLSFAGITAVAGAPKQGTRELHRSTQKGYNGNGFAKDSHDKLTQSMQWLIFAGVSADSWKNNIANEDTYENDQVA